MHSTSTMFTLRTSIERPRRSSFTHWSAAGYWSTSAVTRWFFMPRKSNQKRESWLRTLPLSGTPQGRITSNALMRSVTTISSVSPRSKTSRTLPLFGGGRPGIAVSSSAWFLSYFIPGILSK